MIFFFLVSFTPWSSPLTMLPLALGIIDQNVSPFPDILETRQLNEKNQGVLVLALNIVVY